MPHVTLVTTNEEAIIKLNNYKYHCVFVDNMLSEENGLTLAQYIRHSQDDKIQYIPIILCTAFTGFQSIVKARDAGVTEILAKPISPDQIMEKLHNALFNPRNFVITDHYFGPDRRRRIKMIAKDNEKRQTNSPVFEPSNKVNDVDEETP